KSNKKYNVLDGGRQWTVSDMNVKKELILAGLGWGTLPEYLVKSELDAGRLVKFKSHQIKDLVKRICAFRKKNAVHGPVARKLWEGLQALPDLSDFQR
ncbi:MAG: hypothetical protein HRT88_21135, partial [Lentisphaeraceae bacterium]|nr:hypothetical protein [Lentisphaeraceae bacterium]